MPTAGSTGQGSEGSGRHSSRVAKAGSTNSNPSKNRATSARVRKKAGVEVFAYTSVILRTTSAGLPSKVACVAVR